MERLQLGQYFKLPVGEDTNQGQEACYAVFRFLPCFSWGSRPGQQLSSTLSPGQGTSQRLSHSGARVGSSGGSGILAAVTSRKQIAFPFTSTPSLGRGYAGTRLSTHNGCSIVGWGKVRGSGAGLWPCPGHSVLGTAGWLGLGWPGFLLPAPPPPLLPHKDSVSLSKLGYALQVTLTFSLSRTRFCSERSRL